MIYFRNIPCIVLNSSNVNNQEYKEVLYKSQKAILYKPSYCKSWDLTTYNCWEQLTKLLYFKMTENN